MKGKLLVTLILFGFLSSLSQSFPYWKSAPTLYDKLRQKRTHFFICVRKSNLDEILFYIVPHLRYTNYLATHLIDEPEKL